MKLNDIDLIQLLPQFMRDDKNYNAIAYAVENQFRKVTANIHFAEIYTNIDNLSEEVLDELSWQFNIPEYNTTYDIDVKRNLIKNCMLVHHQRGTVAAIEKVVKDVFGDARVEEWFNYGGEPYHFKVYTSNATASDEMLHEFERIIKVTQNCRSYLEAAVVELFQSMDIYGAATCNIGCFDRFICE